MQSVAERQQAEAAIKRSESLQRKMIANIGDVIAIIGQDSINKYKTVTDPNYCVRVTSDEAQIGRDFLERFQDNKY